jgi:large subunit ribosomal protein L23
MKAEHPYHVIKSPVLSEAAQIQIEAHNKYVFKVEPKANKKQIREAVEGIWSDVKVVAVNTMNYDGKIPGRQGAGRQGARSKWKKAIVTLREGDTIELI